MTKNNIDDKLIETFVYDCERMFLLNFDNTEYEINQTCLTVRKLLIDSPGIMGFWNYFFNDKFKLVSGTPTSKFDQEYLEQVKLYIPLLDILPSVVITNYTSIKLNDTPGPNTYTTKTLEIKVNMLSIDKYLSEDFIVLDSDYVSRKDILEYVAYGTGAIHFSIKQDKLERIKAVKKLNFFYAMGIEKPDSMFFFAQSFRTPEEEKLKDNPEFSKFLMTLGDRHSFESLMTLQIVHEIRATQQVMLLYNRAKDYLVDSVLKYKNYDRNSNFTLVERIKNAH